MARITLKKNQSALVVDDEGNVKMYLPCLNDNDICGDGHAIVAALGIMLKTQDKKLQKLITQTLQRGTEPK